ncbi:hypothetical protein A9Q99_21875 [Gammaproteobacteria bacterium 45_16_T64]|nr:hypothetical protein A9Q99_21875 [Gammaproteobacteria bacterium 45_16_T64]
MHQIQEFIVDHPWFCILFTLVMVTAAGSGLRFAELNNDPRALFSENNEGMKLLVDLEQRFTKDDNVVFIIHPKNNDIFTRENLTMLHELTERAWTVPKTLRVDSLVNFQHTEVSGDDLDIIYLVDEPESLTDTQLAKIKKIALSEPNLVKNVISLSGHVASVNVAVLADNEGGRDAPMIMEYARQVRDEFRQKYPDVEFLLSGHVAFKDASKQATEDALSTTSVYSTIAVIICLYLMLRSVASVILTYCIIALSNVVGLGIIAWLGIEFTPVMGGAPAIILTLAVADSIHILLSYQHQIIAGKVKREAMLESLRINMQPVFLTSVTTAIGFLFLNNSESPPFADMGNLVSIGVMAAWYLSIVFLPAAVMVLPEFKFKSRGDRSESISQGYMNKFADFVIDRRVMVFIVSTSIFSILGVCSLKNEFNDVWFEYFDESFEVRNSTQFMVDELTGHHRIQFAFPSGEETGIMDPEYMQSVDRFVDWAREEQGVMFVSSFSDTIKRLNRDMNGGDVSYYVIPDQRELISQYTLMFQMSLPFGLGLENQIDINRSSIRVDVLMTTVSSNEIIAFERSARQWIVDNLPERMETQGVGFDLLLGELSYHNIKGMLVGTGLALLVVSLLLIVALRSVKYGLLSILPNIFPAIISFGIWGLWKGQIGIAISIVACMTLGIVIDNTVHFLSKYIRARRENQLSSIEATRYAFKTVGIALIATTLVLASNFGMMATSHYYPNASMGMLTAITVAIALAVNFLFFVPLLLFIDGRKDRKRSAGANDKNSMTSTGVLSRA